LAWKDEPLQQHGLGTAYLESRSAEKVLGVLLGGKDKHRPTGTLRAKRPTAPWTIGTGTEAADPGKYYTPVLSSH